MFLFASNPACGAKINWTAGGVPSATSVMEWVDSWNPKIFLPSYTSVCVPSLRIKEEPKRTGAPPSTVYCVTAPAGPLRVKESAVPVLINVRLEASMNGGVPNTSVDVGVDASATATTVVVAVSTKPTRSVLKKVTVWEPICVRKKGPAYTLRELPSTAYW